MTAKVDDKFNRRNKNCERKGKTGMLHHQVNQRGLLYDAERLRGKGDVSHNIVDNINQDFCQKTAENKTPEAPLHSP